MTSLGLGFLGTSNHAVDKKNRVFVAKRFQDLLPRDEEGNRTAILSPGRGQCIWLTTPADFEILSRHFDKNPLDPDFDVDDERDFYEYVSPVSLDTSGRVLLPQDLRELVGIGESVVTAGLRNRVEIWPAEAYANRKRGRYSPCPSAAPREGDL